MKSLSTVFLSCIWIMAIGFYVASAYIMTIADWVITKIERRIE